MSHRQVVLLGRGGLDDDTQALHAVDGNTIAASQEHCREKTQSSKSTTGVSGENVSKYLVFLIECDV